jgi:hypothetical protein
VKRIAKLCCVSVARAVDVQLHNASDVGSIGYRF